MKHPHNVDQVVKSQLCIGCGLCTIDSSVHGMSYSSHNDCMVPNSCKMLDNSISNIVCPGKGYDIQGMAEHLFSNEAYYHMPLGYVNSLFAAHSLSEEVLKNASSGGMITEILIYLIEKKIVDYVSVTQFVCDKDGVHTKTFLTADRQEIIKAQGSKYCPCNFESLLEELHSQKGRVAIMATPCVIAGLREIEEHASSYLKSTIVFHIANFCGGYKSFNNIERLAKIHHVDIRDLKDFRFRGGGQPGSLRFVENSGKEAGTPYPNYVGMTGYSKMLRCHLCPDATGELADISCGDAWIPKYQKDKNTWSMIICRNNFALRVINEMQKEGCIFSESVTEQEVEQSQRLNLASKKKRQLARMKLYDFLHYSIPEFKGHAYDQEMSSMKTEVNVYLKHKLTLWAEKIGLYMTLYGNKKRKKK